MSRTDGRIVENSFASNAYASTSPDTKSDALVPTASEDEGKLKVQTHGRRTEHDVCNSMRGKLSQIVPKCGC